MTGPGPSSPAPDLPAPLGWGRLFAAWLALAAFYITLAVLNPQSFVSEDPDDFMRMMQVRDWLDGQGWFDTRQYRLDPPQGAQMHWVRLVDLPIGLFLFLFRLGLSPAMAEVAASTAAPLFTLGVVMVLLSRIARRLGAQPSAQLLAALLIPAFPLAVVNFVSFRVDHHAWQAACALGMALAMLAGSARAAAAAGVIAALSLLISLEGIAMAACFGAVFAVRYWLDGKRHHEAYLAGLGLSLPLLFLALRPASEFAQALCDLPSWPHVLAFAGGAAAAFASRFAPGQDRPLGRLLSLLPVGAVAAAALFVPLGWCVVSPLQIDPYLRTMWFENMAESAPIYKQSASILVMTVMTLAIVAAGSWMGWHSAQGQTARRQWLEYGAAALVSAAFSMLVMRAGLTAQLMAMPLAAIALVRFLPRASALPSAPARIGAMLALIGLATPLFAVAAARPLDRPAPFSMVQPLAGLPEETCETDRLRQLPSGHIFTLLDRAPEIVARTGHTAVASGYHRNTVRMREVITAFAGPIDHAGPIIRANRADYLVVCTGSPDLWVAARAEGASLAKRIAARAAMPAWLEPVPGFESGALLVYRVKK